ncbi:MAG: metallopeptidase family protein [Alphaproteobacteria bacterium]
MTDAYVNPIPTLDEFDRMVRETFRRLPGHFRAQCQGLVIQVADFADEDTLRSMNIPDAYGLLGLYHGMGLGNEGAMMVTGKLPDMVFLYRMPILRVAFEGGDSVRHVVTHVLVHEIGHHFGLSDEAMDEIERRAGGPGFL